MSFCVYTVLFTLESKIPSENEYVKIFYIWFSQLCRHKATDRCVVLMDTRTHEFLSKSFMFKKMLKVLKFWLNIFLFSPPKTLLEGMQHKYDIFDYPEDYLMYTDLDILFLQHPRPIIMNGEEEALWVHLEMDINDHGYLDAMTAEEKIKAKRHSKLGISAGKFLIKGKQIRDVFFNQITDFIEKNPDAKYYTIEQPIFNKYVFASLKTFPVKTISTELISPNFIGYDKQSILIDFCGEPGNGPTHLEKVIEFLAYVNMT